MFTKILLLCFIYSIARFGNGVDGALKSQKPSKSHIGCGSYFLKEMFHLFSEDKIDNKIQQAITQMKKESRRNKVGFTAQLAQSKSYSNTQIIMFTNVITNIGGGLDSSNGVFRCPEPGVYYIFVNIMTTTRNAYVQIQKNDKFVMYVYTDNNSSNSNSGSNSVILELKRGDRVFFTSHGSVNLSTTASHFSGYRL